MGRVLAVPVCCFAGFREIVRLRLMQTRVPRPYFPVETFQRAMARSRQRVRLSHFGIQENTNFEAIGDKRKTGALKANCRRFFAKLGLRL
jgi:hypothetical protein